MTMAESTPPKPPSLDLPPAILNEPCKAAHPDSQEALQYGRHRVAQELDVISPDMPLGIETTPHASLRSRVIQSSSRTSQERASRASTAADTSGANQSGRRSRASRDKKEPWYAPVSRFWTSEISVVIEDGDPRDYLALERTFLAYLRTSLALAMTGVVIAQLFRLQHSLHPNPEIGFYVVGVPLAASFIALGAVVLLIGAFRFWRQQRAMLRGKVHAGGWELTAMMVLSVLICTGLFTLAVAAQVDKD